MNNNKRFGNKKSKKSNEKGFEKKERTQKPEKSRSREENTDDRFQLEGRNPVMEALNKGRDIDKIFMRKGEIEGTLKVIAAKAIERGIAVQEVDRVKMDYMSRTNNHQGVIALCPVHSYCEVEDILDNARKKGEQPFIIILDEISDPHNLGAIIRTAEACGAHGIIIPKRRAVGLTSIVGKTSAGAVEYVPVAKVTNISKTIADLKKKGIWAVCADMKGTDYFKADLNMPIAIVIGNEGEGVSRLVKESCDFSVRIPMYGEISSLNASVAGALVMYEIVRQRKFL